MGLLLDSIKRVDSQVQGNVAYLYRPETINPARIYLMMDWELWKASKIRPMGIIDQIPLVIRPMTDLEKDMCAMLRFLTYRSFDCWDDILARDVEMCVPASFLAELEHYRKNFKLEKYVTRSERQSSAAIERTR